MTGRRFLNTRCSIHTCYTPETLIMLMYFNFLTLNR